MPIHKINNIYLAVYINKPIVIGKPPELAINSVNVLV